MNYYSTVIDLRHFLMPREYTIAARVCVDGEACSEIEYCLPRDRRYRIPDYQSEIRWGPANVRRLMDDIDSGPKLLGTVVLISREGSRIFDLNDGQQRITVLLMILHSIRVRYGTEIFLPEPCPLENENFSGYQELLDSQFQLDQLPPEARARVEESDDLEQRGHYLPLWQEIQRHSALASKHSALRFLENLNHCFFNVLVKYGENDLDRAIREFLAFNDTGVPLNTETKFRDRLFHLDGHGSLRHQWIRIKKAAAKLNRDTELYPVMEILEHCVYCTLPTYLNGKYLAVTFDKKFQLTKSFPAGSSWDKTAHCAGEDLVTAIQDYSYFAQLLDCAEAFLLFARDLAEGTSTPEHLLKKLREKGGVDNRELPVLHNLLRRILRDDNLMPKMLVVKYFLSVLRADAPSKQDARAVYAIHAYYVLFTLFEDSKSRQATAKIARAKDWYPALMGQLGKYSKEALTRKMASDLMARTRKAERLDRRYRAQALAVLYNYLAADGSRVFVRRGMVPPLNQQLTNPSAFGTEHFIINQHGIQYDGWSSPYRYRKKEEKLVNNLFNFLFLPEALNGALKNWGLADKLNHLHTAAPLDCAYSQLALACMKASFQTYPPVCGLPEHQAKVLLGRYFRENFQREYSEYVSRMVQALSVRLPDSLSL